MAIASGVIFPSLGTHAGIPTGFTRETTLDDKYPLGSPAATNPNVTGGASTHTHATSHTHTVGSHQHTGITSGAGTDTNNNTNTGTSQTVGGLSHTHSIPTSGNQTSTLDDSGSVVTGSGSSLPDSYGIIWIKSDGTPAGIPNGREALWHGASPPTSWTGQSGPAGKYLVGATTGADAGTSSGSATHLHAGASHTHPIADHAHTIAATGTPSGTNTRFTGSNTTWSGSNHTHSNTIASAASGASGSATSGNSGSTNVAPAYYKLGVIRNGTGGDSLVYGLIGAWLGTLASIPSNWILCDGSNGTPDLRDKMIIAAAADLSDVGGTGGATSHDHTDPATHTHSAAHTHTINTTGAGSGTNNSATAGGVGSAPLSTHTHAGGTSGSAGGTSGSSAEAIANASAYPPYRTVAFIMYGLQSISGAGAIASAEAIGTDQLTLQLAPSGVATAEAVGSPTLTQTSTHNITDAGGIATAETIGSPVVAGPVSDAGGIATAEAIGTPALTLNISGAGGIASAEAIGLLALILQLAPSGIASQEAIGSPQLNLEVDPAGGIATAEAIGTPNVVITISGAGGIESEEAVGEPTVIRWPGPPAAVAPPTAAQVADALSGRYGAVDLRFRYSRRTRANEFIDDLDAVVGYGSISLDNTRAVMRDLKVTLKSSLLPADFALGSDIVGVAVEVYVPQVQQWVSMQVGLFLLDAGETHIRGALAGNELIPAVGGDLAMLLIGSVRTAATTVTAGTNYVTAVETILARHGLAYSIPATTDVVPHDLTWPAGTNEWVICRDLLIGINYFPLWFTATGVAKSKVRVSPSDETAAVIYQNTAEPRMVSGLDDYVSGIDRKPVNRASVIIDDPRNADFGYVAAENADTAAPNSTASLAYGDAITIDHSAATSPTLITTTTAHGFSSGVQVLIADHSGSTPDINGSHVITVISPTTFTIPVAVSVGGTGGTVQATVVQLLELKGDSDPSTKAVLDADVAADIAAYELRWAALNAERLQLATLLDPRREPREYYTLDLTDLEDESLVGVIGWDMELRPGAIMRHSVGRARELAIASTPTS